MNNEVRMMTLIILLLRALHAIGQRLEPHAECSVVWYSHRLIQLHLPTCQYNFLNKMFMYLINTTNYSPQKDCLGGMQIGSDEDRESNV